LITKSPGHVQVEVGDETRKQGFSDRDRAHLRDLLVNKFKEKDYDAGLLEAIEYVRSTMDTNLSKAPAGAIRQHNAPPVHRDGQVESPGGLLSGLCGFICFGIVAALVIWSVVALIRAFTGSMGGGRYMGGGGYGPGYGGYGGGGGGGFMTSLLGGLFGAAA